MRLRRVRLIGGPLDGIILNLPTQTEEIAIPHNGYSHVYVISEYRHGPKINIVMRYVQKIKG
jgi:hypothetical protein